MLLTRRFRPLGRGRAFTLVELLVVMAIIALLAAITLTAAQAVLAAGARNRAKSEIQAMTTALEAYKNDNGIYPVATLPASSGGSSLLGPPNSGYTPDPSTAGGLYQIAAQALYQALSGKVNYEDNTLAGKTYMTFKTSQLGNYKALANSSYSSANSTYVADPYGFAYGYSIGDAFTTQAQYPYNGSGFYDLWSTGGNTTATTQSGQQTTNSWITNWK